MFVTRFLLCSIFIWYTHHGNHQQLLGFGCLEAEETLFLRCCFFLNEGGPCHHWHFPFDLYNGLIFFFFPLFHNFVSFMCIISCLISALNSMHRKKKKRFNWRKTKKVMWKIFSSIYTIGTAKIWHSSRILKLIAVGVTCAIYTNIIESIVFEIWLISINYLIMVVDSIIDLPDWKY